MLEPLGMGPVDERVYRAVLRSPGATAQAVASVTGLPPPLTRAALARLAAARLVRRQPSRPITFLATPPDIAITALVNERQADLERARLAIPELLAAHREATATTRPDTLVEVLTGPDVGHKRFLEIQAAATTELLIFDRVSDRRVTGEPEVRAEAPMLGRGVRCRGLYEASSLDIPGRLPYIRRLASLGEQARVTSRLPMKMVICDRRLAMLPLSSPNPANGDGGGDGDRNGDGDRSSSGADGESVLLVGPSALLDALIEVFEAYWADGFPIASDAPRAGGGLSPAQHDVLHLLATGLKDEAIARQLGTSMRTARRRIAGVLGALGVTTRFQAGVEAARRGLL